MAAAASTSLSTALSLYTPQSFSNKSSSSKPTKILSLKNSSNYQFVNLGNKKPIISTSRAFSSSYSFPILNSFNNNNNNSIFSNGFCIKKNDERSSIFKASVSAHQQNQQPHQRNDEDAAYNKNLPSLKDVMQAYKAAILVGDRKAIYELEDMIFLFEKEKTELDQKVLSMSAEISSGKEKYLRLQADFDNYRKRSEKERLNVRSNAQGEVIESLLPMVDSFEKAKQIIKIETEMEKKIDTSYQGIYKQLVEIMRSLRVAVVPTVGKPFDPSMHEAIAREESLEFKEGIVIEEFRRGFYLGDRLLRPAMVKVSSGPGKRKPSSVSEQPLKRQGSVAGVDNL